MERDERRIQGAPGDPMSCEVCRSLILDYVEGALHAEMAQQVETHVAGCPICRMELALAQRIESTLSSQELRLPPADFTARVLSALPAVRTAGESFWSHMLAPMAYAVSILALLLGLSRHLPDLTAMEVAGDALSSVTAMSAQLQGLYSANAPVIHLALAALALLWVLYDDWQGAKE
jgi:predicted anti-sigma-YlaC factor YlaD